ncbi:MAG: hydantoinase/oxoprolinase family protein [Actinobacteria bacterium]|nr:hydantoinase/oxoprolinase family protein [Actinomycetota bacterium]
MRIGVDTGGTFTDLVIAGDDRGLLLTKRPTTPDDPLVGLLDVLAAGAAELQLPRQELLRRCDLFVFGTTRATNAIVEGKTARTALLVSAGHPDILTLREGGGRPSLFDYTHEYPAPYVPRRLTFEVPERIGAGGEVVTPLDEAAAVALLGELRAAEVEAISVCLLWSIINPAHERRLGELIEAELPGVPFTLSHALNPAIREYRRASSAAIDASLKPLMSRFFGELEQRLREEGFGGRLLVMTSAGGVLDAATVRTEPIHSIGSGPAAAPVAGRHFAALDADSDSAIVTDAGGTTYDVSLIRRGQIPWTRETTVGGDEFGHLTGFPSVDARSIGAGGGSIASVDEGGLLHVGPHSAGAKPGPVCYGAGGTAPTVTDACLVLGWLDPERFLGGRMELRPDLAREAIARDVGEPLGLDVDEAAAAIVHLACEHMVRAIEEITLVQGVDPSAAVMVAGGGGGGLYSSAIARRLGCQLVVIPEVSAALSATGTVLSDLQTDFSKTFATSSDDFDLAGVEAVLDSLRRQCEEFTAGQPGAEVSLSVEARYPQQVWEIEVQLPVERIAGAAEVERLRAEFHRVHEEIFAISDPGSAVEFVQWRARARVDLGGGERLPRLRPAAAEAGEQRPVRFPGSGPTVAAIHQLPALAVGDTVEGPAIIESQFATVVVEPGGRATMATSGSLLLHV